ncbi:MAG: hypothetical protein JO338_10880 [Aquitalea sp.]|nr:hypothetical protein [Aquitalea sp.]
MAGCIPKANVDYPWQNQSVHPACEWQAFWRDYMPDEGAFWVAFVASLLQKEAVDLPQYADFRWWEH